jgi:hypothetical protein
VVLGEGSTWYLEHRQGDVSQAIQILDRYHVKNFAPHCSGDLVPYIARTRIEVESVFSRATPDYHG